MEKKPREMKGKNEDEQKEEQNLEEIKLNELIREGFYFHNGDFQEGLSAIMELTFFRSFTSKE
ncbi:hypothetical protein EO98_00730 [Methanosarcina sp. 2.H.T.1A.6]|uniref:hypothetical protein n=1 Tax=unclassified Methanosarcina TaxID=2644672 RepID=UPI0006226EB2|nr:MULTISPECIES: hypothetical protein [unclassified Methanosarcina]KKG14419.1 hypothetical protein EO94_15095 [Methanosarcina sp. 2.H.T.1A.3]KKG21241.1 hypothetical protein EO97_20110 [Methanosarcina sp. 2.H.T.1A.15]KKG21683.1 hypothetical protein EO96_03960 [Methanosarcina sp. 2.H.T.1A.8]KKG25056.1 hypothetical protein EO98_00730 [Methanosarcina sp. 2.H.T.1A.6]